MGKKRRTAAQERATAKMIRANKARRKGKRRGKKNPLVISGKRVKARKVRRGKKKVLRVTGSKLRVRKVRKGASSHPKKSRKKKKSARKASRKGGGGGLTKRQRAARKAARTRKANKAARSLRAKKAARARKRGKSGKKSTSRKARKAKRVASQRRSAKRSAADRSSRGIKESDYDFAEGRRRSRRRKGKRNPIPNPIPLEGGLDFFSGLFAVTLGYIFTSGADRFAATHALTASTTQGGYTDAPAVGQIYNSESPSLPIWSSGMRMAAAAVSIFAPLGLSAVIKSRGPKSFFQLWSFAAIARTLGKAADDGLSMGLKTTSFGLRLYSPEMAAQAKLTSVGTTTAPAAAAPGLFAGAPTIARPLAPPAQRPMIAPPEQPAFRAPPPPATREVAGAPLSTTHKHVAGDAFASFNPFAETDPDRR